MNGEIVGLNIQRAWPCQCGCPLEQITVHSKKSKKLILKCGWCRKRRGHPTDGEVQQLKRFTEIYGWTLRPVIFPESGAVAYAL